MNHILKPEKRLSPRRQAAFLFARLDGREIALMRSFLAGGKDGKSRATSRSTARQTIYWQLKQNCGVRKGKQSV
jgi:hypothetical protein